MAAVKQREVAVLRFCPDAVLAVAGDERIGAGADCILNQIAAASCTPCNAANGTGSAAAAIPERTASECTL